MNNNTTILKEIQPNGRTFNSHLVKLYKTRENAVRAMEKLQAKWKDSQLYIRYIIVPVEKVEAGYNVGFLYQPILFGTDCLHFAHDGFQVVA